MPKLDGVWCLSECNELQILASLLGGQVEYHATNRTICVHLCMKFRVVYVNLFKNPSIMLPFRFPKILIWQFSRESTFVNHYQLTLLCLVNIDIGDQVFFLRCDEDDYLQFQDYLEWKWSEWTVSNGSLTTHMHHQNLMQMGDHP